MAEEPALCRGVSVSLPERFGLNIFQPRRCPFGTQLNEFSRGSNSVQFQKILKTVYLRLLQRKRG